MQFIHTQLFRFSFRMDDQHNHQEMEKEEFIPGEGIVDFQEEIVSNGISVNMEHREIHEGTRDRSGEEVSRQVNQVTRRWYPRSSSFSHDSKKENMRHHVVVCSKSHYFFPLMLKESIWRERKKIECKVSCELSSSSELTDRMVEERKKNRRTFLNSIKIAWKVKTIEWWMILARAYDALTSFSFARKKISMNRRCEQIEELPKWRRNMPHSCLRFSERKNHWEMMKDGSKRRTRGTDSRV